jgi:hypothetical protein
MANHACGPVTIHCGGACTILCDATDACQAATIVCEEGPCDLVCEEGSQVCDSIDFTCGPQDSSLTCNGPQTNITVTDDPSRCACTADDACDATFR